MSAGKINFKTKRNRQLRVAVFARDGYRCVLCGMAPTSVPEDYDGLFTLFTPDGRYLHIDHVIPACAGGGAEIENLQTLCDSCNCRKSGRVA